MYLYLDTQCGYESLADDEEIPRPSLPKDKATSSGPGGYMATRLEPFSTYLISYSSHVVVVEEVSNTGGHTRQSHTTYHLL